MKSERLNQLLIKEDATVRLAMQAIEDGASEITLVINDSSHLVGAMTDGDIRRALLTGADLGSKVTPFINRRVRTVGPSIGRAEVLDMMRAYNVQQLPIVDKNGVLLGLHLLQEILGAEERPNWAVLVAGGRGIRLDPVTKNIPKPMLPVAGRPIIERLVLHLVSYGFRRIFLSVRYLSHIIETHFGNGSAFGCQIDYLKEQQPLGTCGCLSLLPGIPQHPVVVMNGDLITDVDIAEMLSLHTERQHDATLGVRSYVHSVPYGVVQINESRVTSIVEKPTASWLANGGVYILNPILVDMVGRGQEMNMPTLLEMAIGRGFKVGAYLLEKDWMDIGRIEELRKAQGVSA